MDKNTENSNKNPSSFFQTLIVVLAVFLLFFSGNLIGTLGAKPEVEATENEQAQEVVVTPQQSTTQAQSTAAATTEASTEPNVPDGGDTTTGATTTAPTADNAAGVPSTKAEIVALFNESANKVKTDATKVVKNYEYRSNLEEHLQIPKALESMANSLMGSAMQDDLEPIEYATKEDIVANYQVPGQTWVSQLTEAEVAEATCTDNGTEYEVMIKLNPTTDPEPGTGVAKAFDTITASEVKESAPSILQTFTTEYYDCVVKCKIDKATRYTTWANYTSPLILKVTVKMGFTMDAQIGLCFEKDYTITY